MLFGATGAGLAGFKMKRRTQGITEFGFQPLRGTGAQHGEEARLRRRVGTRRGCGTYVSCAMTLASYVDPGGLKQ